MTTLADAVSEKLLPMGFEHFGDGDTWYLRTPVHSGAKWPKVPVGGWTGFVHLAATGRWRALHRVGTGAPAASLYFDDPVAAATWLLMEVASG